MCVCVCTCVCACVCMWCVCQPYGRADMQVKDDRQVFRSTARVSLSSRSHVKNTRPHCVHGCQVFRKCKKDTIYSYRRSQSVASPSQRIHLYSPLETSGSLKCKVLYRLHAVARIRFSLRQFLHVFPSLTHIHSLSVSNCHSPIKQKIYCKKKKKSLL